MTTPASSAPSRSAFISQPHSGTPYAVLGDLCTLRASGAQTGGTLCLLESRVPPGGGPPPHVHSREDETFYVLEGEVTFFAPSEPMRATPGALVHLPRGIPHHFRNDGATEARMLVWCTPSGFDLLMAEMGTLLASPSDAAPPPTAADIARARSACARYGIELLVP